MPWSALGFVSRGPKSCFNFAASVFNFVDDILFLAGSVEQVPLSIVPSPCWLMVLFFGLLLEHYI